MVNKVGFKGFAKASKISADDQQGMLANLDEDLVVYYTGGKYHRRKASGRSASLNTVSEKRKPVPIRTYAQRCFTAAGNGRGFDTSISFGGLRLHQGAKPACYLLLRKTEAGYVAETNIPTPDGFKGSFKEGDLVLKPNGSPVA